LIVHADDDPIVPAAPVHAVARACLPNVSVAITLDGGHVGHFAARRCGDDRTRYWAEERAIAWAKRCDSEG
jgi:predicted alpha/beta-fold hydrolase